MGKQTYIEYAARHLIPKHLDHVLEFGVFKGKTMRIIKTELSKKDKKYEVFGFDSFIGFDEDWITPDGDVLLSKGALSTDGKVPDIPGVTWFTGWFKDTIPEYLKIAKPIALLHLDCDLYKPAKEIFYNINNFIVNGTVIAVDDWYYERNIDYNDTTQKAFYEWINNFNRRFKFLNYPGVKDPRYGQVVVEVLI